MNNSENDEDKSGEKNLTKGDIYVIGVHILFGIVLGVGFTEFKDVIFPLKFNFQVFMLIAVFSTIILSWIGYNNRILKFGHGSAALFSIDIIIVFLYFNMVFSIEHSFSDFLLSFPLIFGFYLIWDFIKSKKDSVSFLKKGEGDFDKTFTEIISFLILLGLWIIHVRYGTDLLYPYEQEPPLLAWSFVVVILVIIFFFRIFEPPISKHWPQKKSQ